MKSFSKQFCSQDKAIVSMLNLARKYKDERLFNIVINQNYSNTILLLIQKVKLHLRKSKYENINSYFTVEDAVQELFGYLYFYLRKFDYSRVTSDNLIDCITWFLTGIAKNLWLKKNKRVVKYVSINTVSILQKNADNNQCQRNFNKIKKILLDEMTNEKK